MKHLPLRICDNEADIITISNDVCIGTKLDPCNLYLI